MGTNFPIGEADYLALGDWNAKCFRCGSKYKASTMLKNWQGFYTCRRCWEPRQPQDFAKGIKEVTTPPWSQPPGELIFTSFCTPNGRTAIPGVAVPGCMVPGFIDPAYIGNFTPVGEIYPYIPSAVGAPPIPPGGPAGPSGPSATLPECDIGEADFAILTE